jgi:hypothetical protein
MFTLFVVLSVLLVIVNIFGIIVISVDHPNYFYKIMKKQKEEGLSILNLIWLCVTPFTHAVFAIKYFVFDNDRNIVYNFLQRPRFFKGK